MYREIWPSRSRKEYLTDNKIFSSVESKNRELDCQSPINEDIEMQLSPLTATWSLPIWEQQLGLQSIGDNDTRRCEIASRIMFISPLTTYELKMIFLNFINNVEIKQTEQHKFTVTFNIQDTHSTLNNVETCLTYDISFGFLQKQKSRVMNSVEDYNVCGAFKCGENAIINGGIF